MEVIYPRCAGLDVHKKLVVGWVMRTYKNGRKKQESRKFGTTTIDLWLAQVMVAEMGIDMGRFPTEKNLAAWGGVAPGNNESAGKTRPGNRYLRKGLVQGAHGASRAKNTYLKSKYHRVAARRGKKRAFVAVAHSMLVSAYHMLLRNEPYQDLGGDYFDQFKREFVAHHLVHRLEKLGFQVAINDQLIPDGAGP